MSSERQNVNLENWVRFPAAPLGSVVEWQTRWFQEPVPSWRVSSTLTGPTKL